MSDRVETPSRLSSKEYTLFLVSTLPVMAGATIAPALPEIAEAFPEESELNIQLILTITALFTGIGSLFVGGLIDKYGRKKPLIISTLIYGFAGSSGLYLNSMGAILIGRAILGLGVAGVMTTTITLIGDYYSGEFRNRIIGLQASVMTFGGVIFIFFGGVLAEINWHFPFALFLIAFLFVLGVISKIEEPERVIEETVLSETSQHEHSIKEHRSVLIFAYSIGFVSVMLFYFIIIYLPFYLVDTYDKSPTDVGIALSLNSLVAGIASLSYKRIKTKYHYHAIFGWLFIFMAIGTLLISNTGNYNIVMLGLVAFGIGIGMFIPNMNSWLFGQTHAPIRGRVIGWFTTFLFLGQFISPFTGNLILNFTNTSGLFQISSVILLGLAIPFFTHAYYAHKSEDTEDSFV